MISSSNFVAIARLVVLARKDPGTTSSSSSLFDPFTLTCSLFSLRAFFKKDEYKKRKFHRHMPNKFQGKSLTLTEHSPSSFVTVTVSVIVRFKINIKVSFEHSVVTQKRNKRPVPNKRPPLRHQK